MTAQSEKSRKEPKSDKVIFKNVFCYFFELIGVDKPENLKLLVDKSQKIEKE